VRGADVGALRHPDVGELLVHGGAQQIEVAGHRRRAEVWEQVAVDCEAPPAVLVGGCHHRVLVEGRRTGGVGAERLEQRLIDAAVERRRAAAATVVANDVEAGEQREERRWHLTQTRDRSGWVAGEQRADPVLLIERPMSDQRDIDRAALRPAVVERQRCRGALEPITTV
jgi:hypothetical protein